MALVLAARRMLPCRDATTGEAPWGAAREGGAGGLPWVHTPARRAPCHFVGARHHNPGKARDALLPCYEARSRLRSSFFARPEPGPSSPQGLVRNDCSVNPARSAGRAEAAGQDEFA